MLSVISASLVKMPAVQNDPINYTSMFGTQWLSEQQIRIIKTFAAAASNGL